MKGGSRTAPHKHAFRVNKPTAVVGSTCLSAAPKSRGGKMASSIEMLVVPFLAAALFVVSSADYPYKEKYTTQQVDHFNYKKKTTFQARYLVSGICST